MDLLRPLPKNQIQGDGPRRSGVQGFYPAVHRYPQKTVAGFSYQRTKALSLASDHQSQRTLQIGLQERVGRRIRVQSRNPHSASLDLSDGLSDIRPGNGKVFHRSRGGIHNGWSYTRRAPQGQDDPVNPGRFRSP